MASGSASPRATVVPRAGVDGGDASPRVVAGLPRVADDPGGGGPRDAAVACRVCHRAYAKYTCPRCFTRYCGLACYKSHDARCVESFHGEQLGDALRGLTVDDEEKRRMASILAKHHRREGEVPDDAYADDPTEPGADDADDASHASSSASDPGACALSEANLEKLARGEDLVPSDLDPETRARFERAAAAGELSHMVEPWTAWWTLEEARRIHLARDGTSAIVDRTPRADDDDRATEREDATASEPAPSAIPSPPKNPLPPPSRLTSAAPAPELRWHLLDVLASYTLMMRAHDGDWRADPVAAAASLATLSAALAAGGESRRGGGGGGGDLPGTPSAAMHGVASRAASAGEGVMAAAARWAASGGAARDALLLASGGRGAVVLALEDVRRVFEAAADAKEGAAGPGPGPGPGSGSGSGSGSGRRGDRRRGASAAARMARKAYFMQCWVNATAGDDGTLELLRSWLAREAGRLEGAAEAAHPGGGAARDADAGAQRRRPLIEEL